MIDQIWKKYDINGDGFLDRQEAKPFIENALAKISPDIKVTDEQIEKTFNLLNIDE